MKVVFLYKCITLSVVIVFTTTCRVFAFAAIFHPQANHFTEEFGFVAQPDHKDASYSSGERIGYTIDVKNNGDAQTGTVGYALFGKGNVLIGRDSVPVNLKKNEVRDYKIHVPAQATGFYKINIIIHITDYDDTIRRVFAVNSKEIKSDTPKPADFDTFWETAREDLRAVQPHWRMTEQVNLAKENTAVYLIEGRSLDNLLIRGWLTIKKDRKPKEKFPVWLVVPGYGGVGVKPIYGSTEIAVLSFNVRGQGNSRDVVHPFKDDYLTVGINKKEQYVYRGAIMDCIRAMDFISTRPELDSTNVIISGVSMGGYLAMAAASLDKRIKLCSASNPVFCDYRALVGNTEWPMSDFMKYSKAKNVPIGKILDVLDYYDLKNFAYNLKCPSLIGISLLDNLAPPYNEYMMLNNIKKSTKYKLFVYPELGHEVPPSLFTYLSSWMMDQFAVF